MFDAIVGFLYQFGDASAFLVLCASGLAIIFGMMGVINLAHGEFIMAGAYMTVTVAKLGAPLPLAIVCGALFAGFIGILLERFVIRHLYGRPLDTIVATWGISLIASQGHPDPAWPESGRHFDAARQRADRISIVLGLSLRPDGDGRGDPRRHSTCSSTSRASACSRGRRSRFPTWPRRSASTRGSSTA